MTVSRRSSRLFRRRQPHLLDMLVDGRVFLDEQVARRHIGLGLVVIVVRDEILDGVLGKELPHFRVELRSQGFIGRQHQRGTSQPGDHIGHRVRFPRAGHAQQGLVHQSVPHAVDQRADRGRLVPRRRIRLVELERAVRKFDESRFGHARLSQGKPPIIRRISG